MKKLCIGILAIIMCSFAFGEIQRFEKSIDVSIGNKTLVIKSENVEKSYILSISNDTVSQQSFAQALIYYDNVSCAQERDYTSISSKLDEVSLNLQNNTQTLNGFISNTMAYYDKYTQCYAQLTTCTDYKSQGYKELLTECNTKTDILDRQINEMTFTQIQKNNSCSQNAKELEVVTSQRTGLAFLSLAFGGVAFWLFWKYVRKRDKARESPLDRGDPRGITGLN